MKRRDVVLTKGPIEKKSGFNYVKGKGFASLDPEPSPGEERQEIIDRAEAGQCPRDEGEFKKQKDGRIMCEKCGLVLTDEVKKKFGIKNLNSNRR